MRTKVANKSKVAMTQDTKDTDKEMLQVGGGRFTYNSAPISGDAVNSSPNAGGKFRVLKNKDDSYKAGQKAGERLKLTFRK